MPEERRIVTVLFADVTGSTELGESLDPEDVRALLSRFYGFAKETVAAHGGTVEKFIGDAVMAVFGIPLAHGDDAERALSAALELRDRVRDDPRLGQRLPVRLGVNTGEVVATRGAVDDFLVTGDAVNVAARLQQAAEPWQILCGERTSHAAARAFSFAPVRTVEAKGKRAGAPAAALLGRAFTPAARIPLVGRDADLAQLELVARRAFAERRPSLISIIAPAGTGKTRLLEEFIDRLPALAPNATVATAQCLPYGQRLTYWPLRAVLFRLAGISERATPSEVREGIRGWLAGATIEDPARDADLLAATVGAGEAELTDRSALLAAWRSAFEHAAVRGPLVVAFEDLHWSSDSLLDLVEFVMQPRGDLPVLAIALTRPELLDRRPSWGGGRRNYAALALEPLPDEAIARLVVHLLESARPDLVARIVARAEGNPFFAGELVRTLLDRVTSFEDRAEVERAIAALPDTVQATVLARLDLLGADERRVLQIGAVLGRTFRADAVAALDQARGDVSRAIDVLVDRDLVRPAGADAFVFRHILIREVAYHTLPRTERARLHAAAGRWLEEFAAGREDAFAELIAYHYREAASLGRALENEAELVPARRKATAWLIRAAEVAMSGAAQPEAARHLRSAIELAAPADLPALYEKLGNASIGAASVDAYGTALRLLREQAGQDPDQELRILAAALGVQMRFYGTVAIPLSEEDMARLRGEARALFERATDERARAGFLIAESFYPFWRSAQYAPTPTMLDAAEVSGRQALAIAERIGDARLQSAALDGIATTAMMRGDLRTAREIGRRRVELRARLDLIELIDAYAVIAWTSVLLGELDEAIQVSGDGLALVLPGQAPHVALHLATWRTLALFLRGRWDEAAASAERMLQLWIEGDRIPAGAALRGFEAGEAVARARGGGPLAERLRHAMSEIVNAGSERGFDQTIRRALTTTEPVSAEALRFAARPEYADSILDRLLAVQSDRAMPPSPVLLAELETINAPSENVILKAQLARARGLAERSGAALTRALELFERTGAVPYAARARIERGLLTGDDADYSAGTAALEALGDLDQLDRYERRKREPGRQG